MTTHKKKKTFIFEIKKRFKLLKIGTKAQRQFIQKKVLLTVVDEDLARPWL